MQSCDSPGRFRPALLVCSVWLLVPIMLGAQDAGEPKPRAVVPKDVLVKTNGQRVRNLAVVSATTDLIKYTKDGESYDLPTSSVVTIEFGDLSDEFRSGEVAFAAGQTEVAAQMFGEAATKTEREVLRTEARFRAASALAATAQVDASRATTAADSLQTFVTENPDSFRLPEALLLLGSTRALGGDQATAITVLTRLSDDAASKGWGALWTARARLERARAEIRAGKADDAKASFQAAASAAGSALASGATGARAAELQAIQRNGTAGEGEAYVAGGDYERAIEFYSSMGKKPKTGSSALYATSQAGLGQALYHASKIEKVGEPSTEAIALLRRAQRALAKASVFDSAGGDTSAKANYYLALCLLSLGAERESDDFQARAQRYLEITVSGYPTSRWAVLARERLGQ